MRRLASFTPVVCLLLSSPASLRAEPFVIDLEAEAAKVTKTAHADSPDAKPKPRAILEANVGVPITVKWTLTHTDSDATVNDVLVHFFVVQEEKPDQQEVPKLTKDVLAESALTMDFKPRDKNEGEITFSVTKPGCYLIRLETKGAAGKDSREPFAALDLVVR